MEGLIEPTAQMTKITLNVWENLRVQGGEGIKKKLGHDKRVTVGLIALRGKMSDIAGVTTISLGKACFDMWKCE